jgi:hypothetical protein
MFKEEPLEKKDVPVVLSEEQRRARINKALGYPVTFNDFSQCVFEKYQVDLIKTNNASFYPTSDNSGRGIEATAVRRGGTLRAAITHGIVTGITLEQADNLKPYIVTWLADEIRAHVLQVVTGPTDPN